MTATSPDARLPAQLEVAGLLRAVETAGGYGAVLRKGEPAGGTILVVLVEKGANARVFERLPNLDGHRNWTLSRVQTTDDNQEMSDYLTRRGAQDPDLWIVELDIPNGERFIGSLAN